MPSHIAWIAALARRLPFYYGWVILFCACCAGFSRQGGAVASLSIFVEPMTREFGWSRTALSGAVSLGGLLAALTSPTTGSPARSVWSPHRIVRRCLDDRYGQSPVVSDRFARDVLPAILCRTNQFCRPIRSRHLRRRQQLVRVAASFGHRHCHCRADVRLGDPAANRPGGDRSRRLARRLGGCRHRSAGSRPHSKFRLRGAQARRSRARAGSVPVPRPENGANRTNPSFPDRRRCAPHRSGCSACSHCSPIRCRPASACIRHRIWSNADSPPRLPRKSSARFR